MMHEQSIAKGPFPRAESGGQLAWKCPLHLSIGPYVRGHAEGQAARDCAVRHGSIERCFAGLDKMLTALGE